MEFNKTKFNMNGGIKMNDQPSEQALNNLYNFLNRVLPKYIEVPNQANEDFIVKETNANTVIDQTQSQGTECY